MKSTAEASRYRAAADRFCEAVVSYSTSDDRHFEAEIIIMYYACFNRLQQLFWQSGLYTNAWSADDKTYTRKHATLKSIVQREATLAGIKREWGALEGWVHKVRYHCSKVTGPDMDTLVPYFNVVQEHLKSVLSAHTS